MKNWQTFTYKKLSIIDDKKIDYRITLIDSFD